MNTLPTDLQNVIYKMVHKMQMEELCNEIKETRCDCCETYHGLNVDMIHCSDCNISFCDQGEPNFIYCHSCCTIMYADEDIYDNDDIQREEIEYEEYYNYHEYDDYSTYVGMF